MESWVFPCNVKVFDISKHLKNHSTLVWKKDRNIRTGDIVYLYLSSPLSQIKYKTFVISDVVRPLELEENAYAIPSKPKPNQEYVMLEVIETFPSGDLSLAELKKHGLGQVQTQARTDRSLRKYLEQYEANQNV